MHFSSILSPLLLLPLTLASPTSLSPLSKRHPYTCFVNPVTCKGRQIPDADAAIAISAACNKLPSCTPSPTPVSNPWPAVTAIGTIPGYTAQVQLGPYCAGIADWSPAKCVTLFSELIDQTCEASWPSVDGKYQLGYARATACDNTFVSLNLGG